MYKVILTIGTIQALAVCIQLIKSKLVAIYLGPAGVGVVGTIDQFVQLAAYISSLSLPAASIKFLSGSHNKGVAAFRKSYAGFFKILLSLSLTGMILTVGALVLKPDIFGQELEKYRLLLILGLMTLPTFTLTMLFINVLAAAQKYKASSLLIIIINTTTTITAVIGVSTMGVLGLYLGSLVAGLVLTIGAMIYFSQRMGLPFYDRHTKILQEMKEQTNIYLLALMLYSSAIAASLAYLVARYSVLKNFGEAEAGLLHGLIAISLALGMALNPAINLYLSPIINRNIERAEKINQAVQFQRKMALILCLTALPIMLFPRFILSVMFSEKFASVGPLVYLFVISQFVLQLNGVYQALLISIDDVKIYTFITIIGQLFFAFMCLNLVPQYGIKAIAWGQVIGCAFIFFLTLMRLMRKHDFIIPRQISLLLGYTFSVVLLTGWICSQGDESNIFQVLLKIGWFILCVGGLFLFLNKEEKEYFGNLRDKLSFGG